MSWSLYGGHAHGGTLKSSNRFAVRATSLSVLYHAQAFLDYDVIMYLSKVMRGVHRLPLELAQPSTWNRCSGRTSTSYFKS